jgi:hypothetical protein
LGSLEADAINRDYGYALNINGVERLRRCPIALLPAEGCKVIIGLYGSLHEDYALTVLGREKFDTVPAGIVLDIYSYLGPIVMLKDMLESPAVGQTPVIELEAGLRTPDSPDQSIEIDVLKGMVAYHEDRSASEVSDHSHRQSDYANRAGGPLELRLQ